MAKRRFRAQTKLIRLHSELAGKHLSSHIGKHVQDDTKCADQYLTLPALLNEGLYRLWINPAQQQPHSIKKFEDYYLKRVIMCLRGVGDVSA